MIDPRLVDAYSRGYNDRAHERSYDPGVALDSQESEWEWGVEVAPGDIVWGHDSYDTAKRWRWLHGHPRLLTIVRRPVGPVEVVE